MGAIYKVVDDGEGDLMLQPIVVTQQPPVGYSTDEVDTGRKWIDGKTIYRKAGFKSGNVSNTILDSYITTSVVDKVIDVGGCYINNENSMQSLGGYSNAKFRACVGVKSNGLLYYSSDDTPHDCSWWIEYTKN